jgi:hypothetical protein
VVLETREESEDGLASSGDLAGRSDLSSSAESRRNAGRETTPHNPAEIRGSVTGCGATYALRRRRFAKSPIARSGIGALAPQWSHGVAAITTVVVRDPATTLRRGMSRVHIHKDAGAAETFPGAPRSQPRPASCHAAPHVFPTLRGRTRPGDEDVGTGWLSSEARGRGRATWMARLGPD